MSTKIGSAYVEIGADTTKLKTGLGEAKTSLTGFKSSIGDIIHQLTGLNLAQFTAAATIGAAAKFISDATKATVEYAEQVRDLGRVSGASSEQSSRLIQVADDLKVSYETLTMAARTASQKGIAMTTESIARLADQYVAIKDPAERAAFAIDKFGSRAGLEMAKMLEKGGDALRKMSDEQNKNLILTEKQVKQARDFEIAQDQLNDTLNGFKYAIGNAVLPAITAFIKGLDELINREERLKTKAQSTAKSYEEYIAVLSEAHKNTGYFIDAEGNLVKVLSAHGYSTNQLIQANYALSKSAWELGNTVIPEVTWQTDQLAASTDEAGDSANYLARAQADLKAAHDAVIGSMREVTTEMLFQKAAANLDAQAALALGRSLGVINEESYSAQKKLADLESELKSGRITTEQYKQMVEQFILAWAGIQSKTVTLTVQQQFSGEKFGNYYNPMNIQNYENNAGGGEFIVPPGYVNDSYYLGRGQFASSGERVEITPAGNSKKSDKNGIVININGITDPYILARQVKGILARY